MINKELDYSKVQYLNTDSLEIIKTHGRTTVCLGKPRFGVILFMIKAFFLNTCVEIIYDTIGGEE